MGCPPSQTKLFRPPNLADLLPTSRSPHGTLLLVSTGKLGCALTGAGSLEFGMVLETLHCFLEAALCVFDALLGFG